MTSGDVSALESLMAPDLLVNAPINKVVDRANVLARVRASQIRYEPSDEVNTLEFVGVRGDCVVVMGEEVVKPIPTRPIREGLCVDVTFIWRETDGVWKLISGRQRRLRWSEWSSCAHLHPFERSQGGVMSLCYRLSTASSRRPSQSSNLHAQICRLSGSRLMLAVRQKSVEVKRP